jgi:hypothetical protein
MSREERASDVAHQEMQAREKQKCRGASRGKVGSLPACSTSTTCTVQNSGLYVAFRAGGSGWQNKHKLKAQAGEARKSGFLEKTQNAWTRIDKGLS